MEDGQFLSLEDKKKMKDLQQELVKLKAAHKGFAGKKNGLTPEQRDEWRLNSTRMNEVYVEIKDLRFKNVMEAGNKG